MSKRTGTWIGLVCQAIKHILNSVSRLLSTKAADHLVVALALSSTLLLLEHFHLLGWADVIMLRLGTVATGTSGTTEIEQKIVIIDIDQPFYERVFFARSPLDRGILAKILGQIAEARPRQIVIDIDASPTPGDIQGQETLDSVLMKTGRELCTGKEGVRCGLVLLIPTCYELDEYTRRQNVWLTKLQKQMDIRFGEGYIATNLGFVIRFDKAAPTLAYVAMESPAGPHITECIAKEKYNPTPHDVSTFDTETPYNPSGLVVLKKNILKASDIFYDAKLDDEARRRINGAIVFVGGSYGLDDKYDYRRESVDGVLLHALSYYSLINPVWEPGKPLYAFVLDLIIGLLSGFLFKLLWSKYNQAAHAYHNASEVYSEVKGYLKMEFLLILVVACLLVVISLLGIASWYLLETGFWLNPGPLIIGMFIHSLLESKEEDDVMHKMDLRKVPLILYSLVVAIPILSGGH